MAASCDFSATPAFAPWSVSLVARKMAEFLGTYKVESTDGFSLDVSVRIAAADSAGRERCCAIAPGHPSLWSGRASAISLYASAKPGPGGNGPQILTPLQSLDRLAALVPPPRVHRHRYFGALAPNSPLRAAVTALAPAAAPTPPTELPASEPAHRRAARYAWAMLLARIYEVFSLLCPMGGAEIELQGARLQ